MQLPQLSALLTSTETIPGDWEAESTDSRCLLCGRLVMAGLSLPST